LSEKQVSPSEPVGHAQKPVWEPAVAKLSVGRLSRTATPIAISDFFAVLAFLIHVFTVRLLVILSKLCTCSSDMGAIYITNYHDSSMSSVGFRRQTIRVLDIWVLLGSIIGARGRLGGGSMVILHVGLNESSHMYMDCHPPIDPLNSVICCKLS